MTANPPPESEPSGWRQPELQTRRLLLRPFRLSDAAMVQRLAGDRDIARMTLLIPHPYEDGMAEEWIKTHPKLFEKFVAVNFAIVLSDTQELIGAIGLGLNSETTSGELGYWLGKPFWGSGYCTEAARAILHYGFSELRLDRIHGSHFAYNPASGRVMQKIGMHSETAPARRVFKWGKYEDAVHYHISREEWQGG